MENWLRFDEVTAEFDGLLFIETLCACVYSGLKNLTEMTIMMNAYNRNECYYLPCVL